MDLLDYGFNIENKEILKTKSALVRLWGVNPKERDTETIQIQTVSAILSLFNIIALRDTDEIYIYNCMMGIWEEDGKQVIRTSIRKLLPKISTHHLNEILDKIRTERYKDRSILNPKMYLGVINGVINLNTFEFGEHAPEHYITSTIMVKYDKEEGCPLILQFLQDVLAPKDIEPFLEAMAYTLYPDYHINKSFLLVGEGANGKSTALNLLTTFLGVDSVISISLQLLGSYNFAAEDLFGKRANIDDDLSAEAVKTTGMFKRLTGNYQVTVPSKNKKNITFKNYAKFFYSMNKAPAIYSDDSYAIWRRFVIFNFSKIIPEEQQDADLIKKLTTEQELSGLLNLLLTRLCVLLKRGRFDTEDSVAKIRLRYKLLSDSVQVFCQEALIVDMENVIFNDEFYEEYRNFCSELNLEIRSQNALTRALPRIVRESKKTKRRVDGRQKRGWTNINFKENATAEIKSIIFDNFETVRTDNTQLGYLGNHYACTRGKGEDWKSVSPVSSLSHKTKKKYPSALINIENFVDVNIKEGNGEGAETVQILNDCESYGLNKSEVNKFIDEGLKRGIFHEKKPGFILRP